MIVAKLWSASARLVMALAAASASCGGAEEPPRGNTAAPSGPVVEASALSAFGDGVTPATAAFQEALNSVTVGGGVRIPRGTYLIDSSVGLTLKNNTTLDLGEAVLIAPNVAGARSRIITLEGSRNIVIRGGTFVGSRSGSPQWGIGILASDCEDVLIENSRFRDFYFDGITLTGNRGCQRVTIRNVVSENNRRTGLAIPSGSDIVVENSTFRGNRGQDPQAGINVEPNAEGVVRRVRLSDNVVEGNAGIGVYIHRAMGVSVAEASVERSTIQGNGQGIVVSEVEGFTLSGNKVLNHSGKGGIVLGAVTQGLLAENTLEGNYHGIFSAGANGLEIRGNIIVGRGPVPERADESAGITCLGLAGSGAGCVVAGNTVRNTAGSGIVSQSVRESKIFDNVIEAAGLSGILLRSTSSSEIRGNTVSGTGVLRPRAHDGIELVTNSNNNVVISNTIRNTTNMRQPIGIGPGCVGNQVVQNIIQP